MTVELTRICPLLLAGGRSRRMGRDKALLQLPDGQTLLARAESLLRQLPPCAGMRFLSPLISGDRPGAIRDLLPGRGPLGGIHSAVEYLHDQGVECDALLVIPVDMPLLQWSQLYNLCAAGLSGGDSALCFGDCYLPLWLRLDGRCRDSLRALTRDSESASVRTLLRGLGGRQLPLPPGNWHANVNRPEEFAALCESAQGKKQ